MNYSIEGEPLAKVSGWRHQMDALPKRPETLTWKQYRNRSEVEQEAYDEARQEWLARSLVIETPDAKACAKMLRRVVQLNKSAGRGESGLIITGLPLLGKTTLVRELGRMIERQRARRNPEYRECGEVPVVFVNAPSNATGRALLATIYGFFHEEPQLPARITSFDLMEVVARMLRQYKTQLLIIDEAHTLASTKDRQGDPTDLIKALQNNTPTTVLLSGVNLLDEKIFGTPRGQQVIARSEIHRLAPLPRATDTRFPAIVRSFDKQLPLIGHEPGLLAANYGALHETSGGSIGELSKVVREIVLEVLLDPERRNETLTRELLSEVLTRRVPTKGRGEPVAAKDLAQPAAPMKVTAQHELAAA